MVVGGCLSGEWLLAQAAARRGWMMYDVAGVAVLRFVMAGRLQHKVGVLAAETIEGSL